MDIEMIEGMLGEHPFGISDAAIDEIMKAVNELVHLNYVAGHDRGWHEGWSEGYDDCANGPK